LKPSPQNGGRGRGEGDKAKKTNQSNLTLEFLNYANPICNCGQLTQRVRLVHIH